MNCRIKGPNYAVGDIEWTCTTHKMDAVRLFGVWGTQAKRYQMVCPTQVSEFLRDLLVHHREGLAHAIERMEPFCKDDIQPLVPREMAAFYVRVGVTRTSWMLRWAERTDMTREEAMVRAQARALEFGTKQVVRRIDNRWVIRDYEAPGEYAQRAFRSAREEGYSKQRAALKGFAASKHACTLKAYRDHEANYPYPLKRANTITIGKNS